MVSDLEMYDSLASAAENRKRLNELIRRYVTVAVVKLDMDAGDIVRLTGWSRAHARTYVDRVQAEATIEDRYPPRDGVAGRARIERELPDLIATLATAEDLVQSIARSCVVNREMSANELSRRTGHSRDYTQKWVKKMRAEPAPPRQVEQVEKKGVWYTPSWDDTKPVDPRFIVSPGGEIPDDTEWNTGDSMSVAPTMMERDISSGLFF